VFSLINHLIQPNNNYNEGNKMKYLNVNNHHLFRILIGLITSASISTNAANWSNTEIMLLKGNDYHLGSQAPGTHSATTTTIQHASGWEYGDNYFYFDLTKEANTDSGNSDIFGEYYTRLSYGKISGSGMSDGFIKDTLFIAGVNYGTNFRVNTFGVGFDLNIPGFDWARFDIQTYKIAQGQVGATEATYQFTPSWSIPFEIGGAKFDFTGFIDIIGDTGGNTATQILTQPQIRLDVGNFFGKPNVFYAGIEYSYWKNKFGVNGIDDHVPQLMVLYKM
jgi:nucleoside-specific outer membrane channel protein Tsx